MDSLEAKPEAKPASQPTFQSQAFRRKLGIGLTVILLGISLPFGVLMYRSTANFQDVEAKFQATWHDDLNENITIPLLKNQITGCLWVRYKLALRLEDGYFVQCSEDGWQTHTSYQILPDGETVIPVESPQAESDP